MIGGNIDFEYRNLVKKNILDIRNFQPHQIKEVEEWSWKKMKNEKWFVKQDCITKRFKKWKLTKTED